MRKKSFLQTKVVQTFDEWSASAYCRHCGHPCVETMDLKGAGHETTSMTPVQSARIPLDPEVQSPKAVCGAGQVRSFFQKPSKLA